MSAYKTWDEACDPEQIVMLYSNVTGKCVYAFCAEHQDEYVHPLYAFNLEYFRVVRDFVDATAKESGRVPRASVPHEKIVTKVCTSPKSLAEHLFSMEVADE